MPIVVRGQRVFIPTGSCTRQVGHVKRRANARLLAPARLLELNLIFDPPSTSVHVRELD